jgi:hypothetical protein
MGIVQLGRSDARHHISYPPVDLQCRYDASLVRNDDPYTLVAHGIAEEIGRGLGLAQLRARALQLMLHHRKKRVSTGGGLRGSRLGRGG